MTNEHIAQYASQADAEARAEILRLTAEVDAAAIALAEEMDEPAELSHEQWIEDCWALAASRAHAARMA